LNANEVAELLGVGRTQGFNLRKKYGLQRAPFSSAKRPLYLRDDVLRMVTPVAAAHMTRDQWLRHHAHLPEVPPYPFADE
jgi:hypothetical protein